MKVRELGAWKAFASRVIDQVRLAHFSSYCGIGSLCLWSNDDADLSRACQDDGHYDNVRIVEADGGGGCAYEDNSMR